MATAKKATAKKAVVAPQATTIAADATALLSQAYRVAAHAHIAKLQVARGEHLYLNNYLSYVNGKTVDARGNDLVLGCALTTTANASNVSQFYGGRVEFRGINAAGDVMIRAGGRDHAVPYNFVRAVTQDNSETRRATTKLNDRYNGEVLGDGTTIAVGCQRFKLSEVKKLVAAADQVVAAQTAAAAARAARTATTVTANPTATYEAPAPKAAKKVAAKKVAAKKATSVR